MTPAEIANELSVSPSTVLRMIHAGELPAIRLSERIYRIPSASFEMFKAGTLRQPGVAPLGGLKKRPTLARGEHLPKARRSLASHAR